MVLGIMGLIISAIITGCVDLTRTNPLDPEGINFIGDLVFEDDFNDGDTNKWSLPSINGNVENDQFSLSGGESGFIYWAKADIGVSDFIFKAKATKKSGSGIGGYGLLFRYSSNQSFYQFSVNGSQYNFWKLVDNNWTEVRTWTSASTINGTDDLLKVDIKSSTIKLYVNDQLLATLNDSSLGSGTEIGLFVENDNHVHFDDVKVRSEQTPVFTPTPTSTATPTPTPIPTTTPTPSPTPSPSTNKPDLIVVSVDGPTTGSPGGSILLTDTVKNQGGVSAASFSVHFYLSTNTLITTSVDTLLGSRNVSSLSVGSSSIKSTSLDIPSSVSPGLYYLGAIVDKDDVVSEDDETNNTGFDPVQISVQSLTSPTPTPNASPTPSGILTWATKTSMPTARAFMASGVVNDKIYAIGGWNGSSVFTKVEEYNPANDTWTTKTSMPTDRWGLAAGVVSDKIYAIGGWDGSTLRTVEEYNPANNTWTTKTSMPSARREFAIGVVNNKIYAIGGCNINCSSVLTTAEEYNPATDTWTTKTSMPTARLGLAIGVVNDKIYAIGGFGSSGHLSKVEEYNPSNDTWTTKTTMPTARDSLAIGVVNSKIYAIGGCNNNCSSFLTKVEEYDPATNTWTTKTSMTVGRQGFALGVVGSKIYAIGGNQGSSIYLSTVEEGNIQSTET